MAAAPGTFLQVAVLEHRAADAQAPACIWHDPTLREQRTSAGAVKHFNRRLSEATEQTARGVRSREAFDAKRCMHGVSRAKPIRGACRRTPERQRA